MWIYPVDFLLAQCDKCLFFAGFVQEVVEPAVVRVSRYVYTPIDSSLVWSPFISYLPVDMRFFASTG